MKEALCVLVCIAFVGLCVWVDFAAPCDSFGASRIKDVPARCIEYGGLKR